MSDIVESRTAPPVVAEDLSAAIGRILQESTEPLTVPKVRARLPATLRSANLEEVLERHVAANVLHRYPKYRSPHERYWDRPMAVHVADLLVAALASGPLPAAELRRKLPLYAQGLAESVLQEQLAKGQLHRHPRLTPRSPERIGLGPPRPEVYLKPELAALFGRLETLGFTATQLRHAALDLLHNEEWASSAGALPPTT